MRDMRNIVVRKAGAPMTIYTSCLGCGELVARYRLCEYYHHGKGLESYLRSQGSAAGESGRDYLAEFHRIQAETEQGYQEALHQLAEQDKNV
jgi:hypothetical protein